MRFREFVKLAAIHYFGRDDGPGMSFWEAAEERAHQEEFESGRQITVVGGAILNVSDFLTWPLRIAFCEIFSHDLRDDSYGGPDSGYMGCECRRCGWSQHTQMY